MKFSDNANAASQNRSRSKVDGLIGSMGEDLEDWSEYDSSEGGQDDGEESSGSSGYRTDEEAAAGRRYDVPLDLPVQEAVKDEELGGGIQIEEVRGTTYAPVAYSSRDSVCASRSNGLVLTHSSPSDVLSSTSNYIASRPGSMLVTQRITLWSLQANSSDLFPGTPSYFNVQQTCSLGPSRQ